MRVSCIKLVVLTVAGLTVGYVVVTLFGGMDESAVTTERSITHMLLLFGILGGIKHSTRALVQT